MAEVHERQLREGLRPAWKPEECDSIEQVTQMAAVLGVHLRENDAWSMFGVSPQDPSFQISQATTHINAATISVGLLLHSDKSTHRMKEEGDVQRGVQLLQKVNDTKVRILTELENLHIPRSHGGKNDRAAEVPKWLEPSARLALALLQNIPQATLAIFLSNAQ